jgi:hypothetical protein
MMEGIAPAVVEGHDEETIEGETSAWRCEEGAERASCCGGGEETEMSKGTQSDTGEGRFEGAVGQEL